MIFYDIVFASLDGNLLVQANIFAGKKAATLENYECVHGEAMRLSNC